MPDNEITINYDELALALKSKAVTDPLINKMLVEAVKNSIELLTFKYGTYGLERLERYQRNNLIEYL